MGFWKIIPVSLAEHVVRQRCLLIKVFELQEK